MPWGARRAAAVSLVAIVGIVPAASATMLPPPIRLALLFGRPGWSEAAIDVEVLPPGHLVERLER